MEDTRIMKRVDDADLAKGDLVVVPVLQDGEGRNVLSAAKLREDPLLGGEASFRIPVCERKLLRRIGRDVGSVWTGVVKDLVPTGRIMRRPGPCEVVEVALSDLHEIPVDRIFAHFRYRNCLVETETATYRDRGDGIVREIVRIHRSFTLGEGRLPERYLRRLPELTREEYEALGRRVDWKRRREEAEPSLLSIPVPVTA